MRVSDVQNRVLAMLIQETVTNIGRIPILAHRTDAVHLKVYYDQRFLNTDCCSYKIKIYLYLSENIIKKIPQKLALDKKIYISMYHVN